MRQWKHIISACPIGKRTIHNRHDTVYAQLHFNICKERGVKLGNEHWHDHAQYQNLSKQAVKVRLPYYGTRGVKLDNKHWYDHVQLPELVKISCEGKVTILWDQHVRTNRIIPDNKPDIIIHDNKKGTCMLIDDAISGDQTCDQER
jgi:hypothetical protein